MIEVEGNNRQNVWLCQLEMLNVVGKDMENL